MLSTLTNLWKCARGEDSGAKQPGDSGSKLSFESLEDRCVMATMHWAVGDGTFSVAANWKGNIAPTETDSVVFSDTAKAVYSVEVTQFTDDVYNLDVRKKADVTINIGGLANLGIENTLSIGAHAGDDAQLGFDNTAGGLGNIGPRKTVVGGSGKGLLGLGPGIDLFSRNVVLGSTQQGDGHISITSTAKLVVLKPEEGPGGDLEIGRSGKGEVLLELGATLMATTIRLGVNPTGSGKLVAANTNGAGTFISTDTLIVGDRGKGIVELSDGMLFSVDTFILGDDTGSEGKVSLTGNSSILPLNNLYVGKRGTGTIQLGDGTDKSNLLPRGNTYVGAAFGGKGHLIVEKGSTFGTGGLDGDRLVLGAANGAGMGTLTARGSVVVENAGDIGKIIQHDGSLIEGDGKITGNITRGAGLINPGVKDRSDIGELQIFGKLAMEDTGSIGIEIGSDKNHDLLTISGKAQLDGDLLVTNFGAPPVYLLGDSFDVLTAGTISGKFDNMPEGPQTTNAALPALTGGLAWKVEYVNVDSDAPPDVVRLTVVEDENGGENDAPDAADDIASTSEDAFVTIDVLANDSDPDDDELTITEISATANGGTAVLDGTSIKYTPGANYSGSDSFTYTIDDGNGHTDTATVTVTITGQADPPSLTVSNSQGDEDTAIALNIAADLVDVDGSETLSIHISGIPSGATLSAGTDNGNGSWTLTKAQLAGLKITPPQNSTDDFTLTVKALATEGTSSAFVSADLEVTVNAVNDGPTITVPGAQTVNEDEQLSTSVSVGDIDAGSSEIEVTVSAGQGVLTLGSTAGLTFTTGDGTQDGSLTFKGTVSNANAALASITYKGNSNYSGADTITVSVNDQGNTGSGGAKSDSKTIGVTVQAVADTPTLTVQAAHGNANSAIPLSIAAGLIDTDGSESLTITISGVPSGATLSAGTNQGSGTWTLSASQLTGLTITPTNDSDFTLTVTATATEGANGSQASQSRSLSVTVDGGSTTGSSFFGFASLSTGLPSDDSGASIDSIVL